VIFLYDPNMSNWHSRCGLSLVLALLAAGGASAQTPAALPRADVATTSGNLFLSSAALDGLGNVTLVWEQSVRHRQFLRRFSAADDPLEPDGLLAKCCTDPRAAANERGDTVVIWNQHPSFEDQVVVRRLSPGLPALTVMAHRGQSFRRWAGDVDIDRDGRFVAVWMEQDQGVNRVVGQRFNADGSRRGPLFTVSPSSQSGLSLSRVAMNHRTGDFVVVWVASSSGGGPVVLRILGQRFAFNGGLQGGRFQVNATDVGDLPYPDVGCADDGSFVVAWSRVHYAHPEADVLVQRYDAAGERAGGETRVAGGFPARLAVAPAGHFAVVWGSTATANAGLSLFRRDGVPTGARDGLALPGTAFSPEVAFGWNGTFVLGWEGFSGIDYQRFAAAPGAEACLFAGGHFRCDADRTGGAPEIDHVFAVRTGTPLLGDVDGDGRDDYCLFRGTRFDCDSGHDFGAAEFTDVFGQPGDTPLLGDVDGDGRDDACVFRAGRFLCDTGHDGNAAELDVAFGQPGDTPLLGDVNGDGRDDPCVVHGGELHCDTAGNGGAAETVIAFSLAGTPLLGDFDGDGRDDPCAFAGGVFFCDTAHDGGGAEATLAVSGSGVPLIGNVDGV